MAHALEAISFREEPAPTATRAISVVREELSSGSKAPFSYEVLAADDVSFEEFLLRIVPKLVYFAQCTGRGLPLCKGLFVSVFVGDRLFFVHGKDFLARAAEVFGISQAELVKRYGPAEELPAGPLMLPGRPS